MSNLVTTRKKRSLANTNSHGLTSTMWPSWIDEVFNMELPSIFTSNFNTGLTLPKVNIRETKEAYFVDMAVPGLKKTDFHIDLDNQLLSISTELEESNEQREANFTRREFEYSSFKRSFSLPETVNEHDIKAEYNDGILSIHMPKKEKAIQKPARSIKIS